MVMYTFNLSTWRQMQVDVCEIDISLIYIASSISTRVHGDTLFQKIPKFQTKPNQSTNHHHYHQQQRKRGHS